MLDRRLPAAMAESAKVYDKLYHELMNEPEKETVMQDIHNLAQPYFP